MLIKFKTENYYDYTTITVNEIKTAEVESET